MLDRVIVSGAREHNLRDISLEIPRGALVVFTGVSGSGKSSLAYDTLFKEGQRRFVQSLSSYARQFLGQMERPDVDHVEGLSAAVAIDQKTRGRNPRSTVGTITEIWDHLRLLYARLGIPHCPECGIEIRGQSAEQVVDRLLERHAGARCLVLAPVVYDRKGEYRKELSELAAQGFLRVRVDGEVHRTDGELPALARYERHTIEVVYDRLTIDVARASRLTEAIEKSFELTGGLVSVLLLEGEQLLTFSRLRSCPDCGCSVPEMEPRTFSFNSRGACPECNGLGRVGQFDEALIVPDRERTIARGALKPCANKSFERYGYHWSTKTLTALVDEHDIPTDVPWGTLTARQRRILLQGGGRGKQRRPGILEALEAALDNPRIWAGARRQIERFMSRSTCPACDGTRLDAGPRAVRFRERSIADLHAMTVDEARAFVDGVTLTEAEAPVGRPLLAELGHRLQFLAEVGLGYLALERSAATLAGGESQRIRLAGQLGARLQGVLYILDEPSIGLHPRDNQRLIGTLTALRDQGNTVFVIEHDEDMIRQADHVIDLGPGAGVEGGQLIYDGPPGPLLLAEASLTGDYLAGRAEIALPSDRRPPTDAAITVRGATHHNLEDVDAAFPVGLLTVVVGVSGSGKSSLVEEILHRALAARLHNARAQPGAHRRLTGAGHVDKVIEIDQDPIGRTPRSNPATYTKVFDQIRALFAETTLAKARGYKPGRFSFNKAGGRCETCEGAGCQVIEMQFLADVLVPCEECEGRRYNPETLEVRFKERSITDVLEMTIEDARTFFGQQPRIARILETLHDVGMGYVRLGQPSTTLSGGEAQRIKLAKELARPSTGRTLYILDEPTTGLHFADIARLIECLQRLVDQGNTVVVIEHNLDVVKVADHLIELGPEGGGEGGQVVYQGPFEPFLAAHTHTADALRRFLDPAPIPAGNGARRPARKAAPRRIEVRGAYRNNLKRIDVDIPHDALTVVTGLSGSGKSSLVFETLFAEGQRRFVESLSTYARRFISRLGKAPVDRVSGLAPAIAIDQSSTSRNPRSTVATTTEIYDYLRLLYARLGTEHCLTCDAPLVAHTPAAAARAIAAAHDGEALLVLAPLWHPELAGQLRLAGAERLTEIAADLVTQGYRRVLLGEALARLDEPLPELTRETPVQLVLDRVTAGPKTVARLAEAVESAYDLAAGHVAVRPAGGGRQTRLAAALGCPACFYWPAGELTPRMFSFNSWQGACEHCGGLGAIRQLSLEPLLETEDKPLFRGALPRPLTDALGRYSQTIDAAILRFPEIAELLFSFPLRQLSRDERRRLMDGDPPPAQAWRDRDRWWRGALRLVEEALRAQPWALDQLPLDDAWSERPCPACDGDRLKPRLRAVRVAGRSIAALCRMTVADGRQHVDGLGFAGDPARVAEQILTELRHRLGFLVDVGLGYLTLDRGATTLSGGEAQRIRLATQIGNRLVGVLYCLDEPTIGLHARDTDRLLRSLEQLRDIGNTIVLVEHDLATIRRADRLIELGPAAGEFGGEVVASGTPRQLARWTRRSLTGAYLAGARRIEPRDARRSSRKAITIKGATLHNLQGIDVRFPLGTLTVVSGVSGGGKSSLVADTLYPALRRAMRTGKPGVGPYRALTGTRHVQRVQLIDQERLGTTPRSCPATYLGLLDPVRDLFASTVAAKARGFTKGRFSFNLPAGQCATCQGKGALLIEMHFLSDVWTPCADCGGRRYNKETLEIRWKGHSIADVLRLTVREAAEAFKAHRKIQRPLALVDQVGLGYLRLGQGLDTLSGGEAQRVKLAAELGQPGGRTTSTLYLMDEPTTGLHAEDVRRLLAVLQQLVDAGHSAIVVEHHPDVVAAADHVIDLGPEAGDDGGRVVVAGTPEEVAACPESHTGKVLAELFAEQATCR